MGRDELEEAIHAVEHALLPEAIGMIATGRVRIADEDPNSVIIDQ
jgi:folate-dependent phosphoribosylglycinamide formyltransferase PurN